MIRNFKKKGFCLKSCSGHHKKRRLTIMKCALRKKSLILMLFLLLFTVYSMSQEIVPLKTDLGREKLIGHLEKALPELMKKADIPGMSIAVIQDGKIIWTEGFGIKNTKTGEPVNKDTVFEAASLTKPFFAYVAMKLVESRELDLDKPLVEYVPEDYLVKEYIRHPMELEGFRSDWFRRITARMVLSHSSGLPHGESRKPLPIFFEPGTQYRYSADGYMYLQRVIEHLRGESLTGIMRELAIEPLEMEHSSMVWQERYETQSAVGHDVMSETNGRFRKRRAPHAAATLYTTAEDYAKFVVAMMNDVGLKSTTIAEMLTPQINVDKDVFWGLGFGLEKTPNGKAFWQWGDYGIFRNYVVAYKEKKIGVVYLTNGFNGLSIGGDVVKNAIGGGDDLGLAYLDYARYDSPTMQIVRAAKDKEVEEVVGLFQKLRKEHPDDFAESDINNLGYFLMNAGRVPAAIEIFKINAEYYPNSANVYDSLAEAYMNNGDTDLAIKYYKKALETVPKDSTTDKDLLERVKQGASEKLKELEAKKQEKKKI
jgi:CubicO group peptidase (beta-lactamase class C family)